MTKFDKRAKQAYDDEVDSFQERGKQLRRDIEKFSDKHDQRLNGNFEVARAALGILWKGLHAEIYRDSKMRQEAKRLGYEVTRGEK